MNIIIIIKKLTKPDNFLKEKEIKKLKLYINNLTEYILRRRKKV
jgi:hypothetical protein